MAVDDVVAGHDAPDVVFLHDNLKGLQVDFADGALGGPGIGLGAVGLLVVQGQVLGRGGHAVALHAPHQRPGQVACEQRVLGEVFKVPAAQRIAVNVDGGGQPGADAVFLDFLAGGTAHGFGESRVPGAGQQAGAGEGRGRYAHLRLDAQARGAVGGHGVGHAEQGQVAVAVGVRHAGVGLAAQQPGDVLVGQLGDEIIQGEFALGHLDQLAAGILEQVLVIVLGPDLGVDTGNLILGQALQHVGVRVVGRAKGQVFIAAVRQHALFQLGGRHPGGQLFDNPVGFQRIDEPGLPRSAHVCAHKEAVFPRLQHPGRLLHLTQVVIGGHLIDGEANFHGLGLPGQQLAGLPPTGQLPGRLAQPALGRGEVDLHDLLASYIAHIGHGGADGDVVALEGYVGFGDVEAGV